MEYLGRSSAADDRQKLDYEEIFGNDSGEDENPKILAGYFVELQSFSKAYDKNRPLEIIKARKGMGKSALLSHLKYRLTDTHSPIDPLAVVIKVTGNELMGLADFSGTDSSLIENRWRQVICKRISLELAKEIGFAASDDSMSLIEASEIEGFKGRNLVAGLMARLGSVIESATKALLGGTVGLKINNPTDSRTLGYEQMLRRIQESRNRNVWLLVDDIDAKFIDTEALHTRIGAFFSALRSLAFSVEGLRVRASVRTDVWTHLRSMEDEDKLRQYISEIKWTEEQLKNIFVKRILSYLQRNGDKKYENWNEQDDYQRIVNEVFGSDFRIRSEKKGDPLMIALVLAGKRPRWMGQLCKQAGSAAGALLIQQRHFNAVMSSFGREKISDLIKEHQHQFAELQKVIDAFRASDKTNARFKLISLIERGFVNRFGKDKVPSVNGFPFQHIEQIAELLYEIDFIVGEKAGKQTPFHDDPTLFRCEANQQNKVSWMVNLSYRSYLGIQ